MPTYDRGELEAAKHELRWEVKTVSRGHVIQQTVTREDNGEEFLSQVIDLRREGLRKALIDLGWKPPPGANFEGSLRRVVASEDDQPGFMRYTLSCGHKVVRRGTASKKRAICDECDIFPGII